MSIVGKYCLCVCVCVCANEKKLPNDKLQWGKNVILDATERRENHRCQP
jgi:predicted kinase